VSGVTINEICPCCGIGREVSQVDVPRVDLNTSRLFVSGKAIRLAPQLADATATLALNVGKPVNAEFLATKIWGAERPPTYKNIISVYLTRLQKLFQPFGYDIFTAGRGRDRTLTLARSS
jgi:DNA-binding response OmpR family regulator